MASDKDQLDFSERHSRTINGAAVVSAGLVVFNVATSNLPEVIPLGTELSTLGYDAGLAYLTAWAFHQLVIVMPESMRAKRVQQAVAPQIDNLVRLGHQVAEGVARAAEQKPTFPISDETVSIAVAGATPKQDFPGWQANWLDVVAQITRQASEYRSGLRPFYMAIPADLLDLLLQEERDGERLRLQSRATRILRKRHLRDIEASLKSWLGTVAALEDMRKSKIARHVAQPGFEPRDGMIIIPLDQIEADFERLGVADSDEDA